jgi:hypothetical protein
MSVIGAFIVIFVIVGVSIAGVVPLAVMAIRQHNSERHRLTLSHYYFCGHPEVALPLSGWNTSAAGIRLLAWQRGYVEVGGRDPNTLVFRLAEARRPGNAATPAMAVTGEPTRKQLRRRRQLTTRLMSGDIAWVQPRQLAMGMAELDNIARARVRYRSESG